MAGTGVADCLKSLSCPPGRPAARDELADECIFQHASRIPLDVLTHD